MSLDTLSCREAMIATARRMNAVRLTCNNSGNLSVRTADGFLVTPSGMSYDSLVPQDIVRVGWDGSAQGRRLPSSEWHFHRDILTSRPEIGAVLHAHAPFSTVLACHHRGIPAFHYMVAVAGSSDIRCAPYATFGTAELSRHAVAALDGRLACLLANHGLIALGTDLEAAFKLAVEVEALAEMYWRSLQIGQPIILDKTEMAVVIEKFKTYGKQPALK